MTHVSDGIIFEARYLDKFPRNIVELRVDVSDLENHVLGAYGRSPSRYAPLMRRSCANSRFEAVIFSSIMSHGRSAEVARKECEYNIDGYHVRNYQPGRIPALSSFLGELTDLPILFLEGCACWPRLRICHGCHDVFKYNVAPQIFLSSQNSALLTCSFAADHSGLSFRAILLPSNLSASTKSF
jgi:hypothetical protein